MLHTLHTASLRIRAASAVWKRKVGSTDLVWLARFRLLALYVILKSVLLGVVGLVGLRLSSLITLASMHFSLLLWTGTILSICASFLMLLLGLVFASRRRPRFVGISILCIADVWVLMAVFCASVLGSFFLLLVVLMVISCTTPLLVERISRFAKSDEYSKYKLMSMQRDLDLLLQRFSQEVAMAVESERSALRRKLHDKLMQELNTVLLQIGIILMDSSEDGNVQLNAVEVAQLEASLQRVAAEAQKVMRDLKTPQDYIRKAV